MPNSAPCQIMHPLVLVGLGVGVGEGLGLGVGLGLGLGSDFNKGMHNLAGVQISAQHRTYSDLPGPCSLVSTPKFGYKLRSEAKKVKYNICDS